MSRSDRRRKRADDDDDSDDDAGASAMAVHITPDTESKEDSEKTPESLDEFMSNVMVELKRARTLSDVEECANDIADFFDDFECKGHEQEIATLLNLYAGDLKTLDFAVLAFACVVSVSLYEHVSSVLRERCLALCPMTPGGRLFTDDKNTVLAEGGWSISPLRSSLYQDELYKVVIAKIGSVFDRRAAARSAAQSEDPNLAERQRLMAELLEDEQKSKKKQAAKQAKPAPKPPAKADKGKTTAAPPGKKETAASQKSQRQAAPLKETVEEILANAAKRSQQAVDTDSSAPGMFVPVRSTKPAGKASGAKKKESEYAVTIETFPILKNLYSVVLKSKLEIKFRELQVTASDKSFKETVPGGPNVEVTLRIRGPEPDATSARDEVQRIAADPRGTLSKVEFPFPGKASQDRLSETPQQLQCVTNFLNKKSSDTSRRWFVSSFIQLTGEELPPHDVLISKLKDFLIYDPMSSGAPKQLRHAADGDDSDGDGRDDDAADEEGGALLHEDDGNGDDDDEEDVYERNQPVEELPRSKAPFREAQYLQEMHKSRNVPPQQAVDNLKRLVDRFEKMGSDTDVLGWLRFMYNVEQHYALAVLAKYERSNCQLQPSVNFDCVLSLQADEERFTERRPSVQVDDRMIIKADGKDYAFRIYHVDPVSLKLLLDSSAHTQDEKAVVVKAVTSQLVTVLFDPEPVTQLCQMRSKAATCEQALAFLVTPQAKLKRRTESWRRLAQQARDASTDKPLTTEQHYALHLILSFPKDVRSLFVSGPPGTGKSEVIAQAIKELLVTRRDVRIVVCAPSHSAIDIVCERIVKLFTAEKSARSGFSLPDAEAIIRRVHSPLRSPFLTPPVLLPFTTIGVLGGKQFRDLRSTDRFDAVNAEFLTGAALVCCSISQVGKVVGLMRGVDYLFVDEAAQAHLADVLFPIEQVLRSPSANIVFSGDAQQVRPHCLAPFLRKWIHRSPMFYATKYGKINTVELVESFRQNEQLCNLQSKLFYNGKLQFHPTEERSGPDRTTAWVGHRGNPQPLRFIHHEGTVDNASLEDVTERNLVNSAVNSLCADVQIDPNEIVVVCGSAAQRRGIKNYLTIHGFKQVRVLEIIDFHGAECDVVIICSLHASNEATGLTATTAAASAASAAEPSVTMQELNTAMSRARHLVLLFGNGARLLSSTRDKMWERAIAALKERRAIDGYNYDTDRFDASLYEPLPIPVGALKIRAFVPGPVTKSDLNARREIACFVDRARNSSLDVHDYVRRRHLLVGTVVLGPIGAEDEVTYRVRNRNCSGHDAVVDVECSAGRLNVALVPGETVAVCCDEARAEAASAPAALCGFLTTVLPQHFVSGPPALSSGSHVLDDYDQQAIRPKGPLAAYIKFPVFPPVPVRVSEVDTVHRKVWAVAPSMPFLPPLLCILPRPELPPVGAELAGVIQRNSGSMLLYTILMPSDIRTYGKGIAGSGPVPAVPGGITKALLDATAFTVPSFAPIDRDHFFSIGVQDTKEDTMLLTMQVPYWLPMLRQQEVNAAYDVCFARDGCPTLFSADLVLRRAKSEHGYIPMFEITATMQRHGTAWALAEKRVYLVRCLNYVKNATADRVVPQATTRASRALLHEVLGVISSRATAHVDPWVCLAGLIAAEGMLAYRPLDALLVCEHVAPERDDVVFDSPRWFVPHTPDNQVLQIDGFYGPCPAASQPIAFISSGPTRFPDLVAQNLLAAAINNVAGPVSQRQTLARIVDRVNASASLFGIAPI